MLIETIISIAVFALVIVAVTTLIAVSHNMLNTSQREYARIEGNINAIESMDNAAIAGGAPGSTSGTLTYTFSVPGSAAPEVEINQDIAIQGVGEIVFFAPKNT